MVHTDGLMTPLPPAQRALDDAGVPIVEPDITSVSSRCQSLADALLAVDGTNARL
jgi:hypothetical protein